MIDEKDRQILSILQENARTANADVARQIGMAQSGTHERVRKLEERGVISGYETRLNAEQLGLPLMAFIFVRSSEGPGEIGTGEAIAHIPEVLEVHHVAGEDCLLVKVRVSGTQELAELLREKIGAIATVDTTRTTIVLETIKETSTLPLG